MCVNVCEGDGVFERVCVLSMLLEQSHYAF